MTTYAERLARRTRNTFKPVVKAANNAQKIFNKVKADAPGIFKKVESGTNKFFNKTLPSTGRMIGRGLEQAGGTLSKVASGPIGLALAASNPELAPFILGTAAAGEGIRQSGGLVRQTSQIGQGLSRDLTTAQNQLLERAKPIDDNAKSITFK